MDKEFCEQHKGLPEKQEECFDCIFAEGWNKGQKNLKDLLIALVQSLKQERLTTVVPEFKSNQIYINGFNDALYKVEEEIENLK